MIVRLYKEGTYSRSNFNHIVKSITEKHLPKFGASVLLAQLQGDKIDERAIKIRVEVDRSKLEELVKDFVGWDVEEVA